MTDLAFAHGFGIGDVVRLKTGGRSMLVVDFDAMSITCAWPINGKPAECHVRPGVLLRLLRARS